MYNDTTCLRWLYLEHKLLEVIVSHTDENGILQLFRMQEDGSNRRQLTHSDQGCRIPR